MISLVNPKLLDILTFGNRKVSAMALWPFVIFRNREASEDLGIINHERIHHRQQIELLIFPYYFWYFIEYWTAMFRNGFRHFDAYMSVSFEQEAYAAQNIPDYLSHRKWLSSWPFLMRKIRKS